MAKKPICIEALLTWAYRHELPKQAVGGLTGWERIIYLGTTVDESHHEARLPVAMGAAHDDAIKLDYIVRNVLSDRVKVEWPRARADLMGALACWLADDDPLVASMLAEPIALVMAHAKMGTRPSWDRGLLRLVRVNGKNGKPQVNGITAGRRYAEGAHCPLRLDCRGRSEDARRPLAAEIACDRFQYRVWHAALVALAGESWNLSEHVPMPPAAAAFPWREDNEKRRVILRDVSPRAQKIAGAKRTAC